MSASIESRLHIKFSYPICFYFCVCVYYFDRHSSLQFRLFIFLFFEPIAKHEQVQKLNVKFINNFSEGITYYKIVYVNCVYKNTMARINPKRWENNESILNFKQTIILDIYNDE